MPIHLEPAPDNVHWGYFDARLSPRVAIDSGERVTISSVSGGPELMPGPPLVVPPALPAIHAKVVRQLGPHMLTGPVAVKGAKPGQVLQVDIESIDVLYDWGYNSVRPLAGALPDDFAENRHIHVVLDRARNSLATAVGPGGSAGAVLRRHGHRAAAGVGHDLDRATAPERRQSRQ